MSIKNIIQIAYKYENSASGSNDNFVSEFNMMQDFTVGQLAAFLKVFFYKLPFFDKKAIDWIIPNPIIELETGSNRKHPDDEKDVEPPKKKRKVSKEMETLQSYYESLPENIEKIVDDAENIKYFKEQLQDNPELLKEAFKSFLKDTLEM